jgi:hypothetical protein
MHGRQTSTGRWSGRRSRMVTIAGLFVLSLGAGCGSGDDGSDGGGAPADDAAPAAGDQATAGGCAMATVEEIKRATGVTFTLVSGSGLKCEFKSADDLQLMYAKVEDDASRYQTLRTITAEQIVDVPGVGDKAFYAPELPNVTVAKGDDVVTINLFSEPPPGKFEGDTKAKLVELGKAAAGHM